MKITDLSIADAKALFDFVGDDLKEMGETAKKKGIATDQIPAYNEVKEIEDKLYHYLLNISRALK